MCGNAHGLEQRQVQDFSLRLAYGLFLKTAQCRLLLKPDLSS